MRYPKKNSSSKNALGYVQTIINNYLLNGDKVKLFSRDKTRDILFLERQREK